MKLKLSRRQLVIVIIFVVAVAAVGVKYGVEYFNQSKSSSVISGKLLGGESKMVYLQHVEPNASAIVDSVELSARGEFEFTIKECGDQASLYYVVYDMEQIPLVVAKGDDISISSMGHIVKNYTVEGSSESQLLRQFWQPYMASIDKLEEIKNEYTDDNISQERKHELEEMFRKEHIAVKQSQLKFIIENEGTLASLYALYQRQPNDEYQFSRDNDIIYYRQVAEALAKSYPQSPYTKALQADIDEYENVVALQSQIKEVGYPDLNLKDMYGKKHKLSSLEGKVILLDFWSAQIGSSNIYNADLKEIYAKYHEQGFEVYQVAIDESRAAWIATVQDQRLPWISVADFEGENRVTVAKFNISRLPSNILISKGGDVVVRDIYGDALIENIERELAK